MYMLYQLDLTNMLFACKYYNALVELLVQVFEIFNVVLMDYDVQIKVDDVSVASR